MRCAAAHLGVFTGFAVGLGLLLHSCSGLYFRHLRRGEGGERWRVAHVFFDVHDCGVAGVALGEARGAAVDGEHVAAAVFAERIRAAVCRVVPRAFVQGDDVLFDALADDGTREHLSASVIDAHEVTGLDAARGGVFRVYVYILVRRILDAKVPL